MQEIIDQCEILISYPIGKIFTSDTPSQKEKKAENRCTKLVDQYYTLDSSVHKRIRMLLNELQSNLLLMCNTTALEDTFETCGRLQTVFDAHSKLIKSTIKTEPALKDYYNSLQKPDWWGKLVEQVTQVSQKHDFCVDLNECKQCFTKGIKLEKE